MADNHAYLGLLLEKQNEGLLEKIIQALLARIIGRHVSGNAIFSALAPQGVGRSCYNSLGQYHTSRCIVEEMRYVRSF